MSALAGRAPHPIKVAHVITKLAVGGAQESALTICAGLPSPLFDQVVLTGPEVDAEGSLFAHAAARGIAVKVVPSLVRSPHPWRDAAALRWLVRWLRDERPDLVHTHSSKAGLLGRAAARIAGVPAVHSVHGWSFNDETNPVFRRAVITAERAAARATEVLVVVASSDREKGLRAGIGRPDQYRLVRNGIDLRAFVGDPEAGRRLRLELGIPRAARVVGTVGRLAAQKDPLGMVRAMQELIGRTPDVWFVWVGDGPLRAAVESEAARLGIADRFLVAGVRRDVAAALAAMDVFALSSRWEGLPITITEAMAAGVPVVATAVDGCREIVAEGVTGLLVPPADPVALATAIGRLLQSAELASALAAAAKVQVAAWDRPTMVAGFAELYQGAIQSRHPTPV
jgi:glycosyltransferase involved in cell wall biosynthesis